MARVDVNLPGFNKTAQEMTSTVSANTTGFLNSKFVKPPPRLYISAETDDVKEFDQRTLQAWRDEGFDVRYLPYGNNGKGYINDLKHLGDGLGIGETYAIIAYGDAASLCLQHHVRNIHKLTALVAYYPSTIPDPQTQFPLDLKMAVHLAGDTVDVIRSQELLGIQGKKKSFQRNLSRGQGLGGRVPGCKYPVYNYEGCEVGFAERDLDEYDLVAADIAFTRSLDTLRRACANNVRSDAADAIESLRDNHLEGAFFSHAPRAALEPLSETARVSYTPTSGGGIGKRQLSRFYSDFFCQTHSKSLDLQLVSRTMGVNRVVDEILVSFTHDREMPWILPGVPPTKKDVEIMVVSVVTVRANKIAHENVYWDQASVLVQTGLLDEKMVPRNMKGKMDKLPVVGKEGTRKAMGEETAGYNRLIDDF